jgi:sugar O-acyltransferase (sialic acid O-acetyltransferase NeuD family)
MMKKVLIYGNGKMAKILFQYMKSSHEVIAFTVDRHLIGDNKFFCELPLIAFDEVEKLFTTDKHNMIIALGYLNMNQLRLKKYDEAKQKGYKLINYIHPSATIQEDLIIGDNNVILDHVSIQPGASLGSSNYIWSNSVLAHGSSIQDGNWIASGVVISGDTKVGSCTFMGVNASIGHSIAIGDECFVGANALVAKSTEAGSVWINKEADMYRLDSQRFLKFAGV